jgi:hypothetical protein
MRILLASDPIQYIFSLNFSLPLCQTVIFPFPLKLVSPALCLLKVESTAWTSALAAASGGRFSRERPAVMLLHPIKNTSKMVTSIKCDRLPGMILAKQTPHRRGCKFNTLSFDVLLPFFRMRRGNLHHPVPGTEWQLSLIDLWFRKDGWDFILR